MNEFYPTLLEMMPWHKRYPITRKDGWHIFRGPKLGSICPDDYIVSESNQPQVTLHSLMDKTFTQSDKKCFVMLFDGVDHGDTTVETKDKATQLEQEYGAILDAVVITHYYDTNNYDVVGNILGDTEGSCAKHYGASGPAIYVVDREKKIIWKSSGLMLEKLHLYLQSESGFTRL